MSEHLKRQISVARGRIQSSTHRLKRCRPGSPAEAMHKAVIAREREFIRTAQRAMRAEAEALRKAVQAAFDCGMVPRGSARDGGASKHVIQYAVADMLRDALAAVTAQSAGSVTGDVQG